KDVARAHSAGLKRSGDDVDRIANTDRAESVPRLRHRRDRPPPVQPRIVLPGLLVDAAPRGAEVLTAKDVQIASESGRRRTALSIRHRRKNSPATGDRIE